MSDRAATRSAADIAGRHENPALLSSDAQKSRSDVVRTAILCLLAGNGRDLVKVPVMNEPEPERLNRLPDARVGQRTNFFFTLGVVDRLIVRLHVPRMTGEFGEAGWHQGAHVVG